MVLGLVKDLELVCENEGGDDIAETTGLVDERRFPPTIDSEQVIQP